MGSRQEGQCDKRHRQGGCDTDHTTGDHRPGCPVSAVRNAVEHGPTVAGCRAGGPPGDPARWLNGDVVWAGPLLRPFAEVECCLRLSSADALPATAMRLGTAA